MSNIGETNTVMHPGNPDKEKYPIIGDCKKTCATCPSIGTFNRLSYDNCEYRKTLQQSTSPLMYKMSRYQFENCDICTYDGRVYAPFDLVDQESELIGLTRPNSKCDELKYDPRCPDSSLCTSTFSKSVPIVYAWDVCPVVCNNLKKFRTPGYELHERAYCGRPINDDVKIQPIDEVRIQPIDESGVQPNEDEMSIQPINEPNTQRQARREGSKGRQKKRQERRQGRQEGRKPKMTTQKYKYDEPSTVSPVVPGWSNSPGPVGPMFPAIPGGPNSPGPVGPMSQAPREPIWSQPISGPITFPDIPGRPNSPGPIGPLSSGHQYEQYGHYGQYKKNQQYPRYTYRQTEKYRHNMPYTETKHTAHANSAQSYS
jgi:hypothetical protein